MKKDNLKKEFLNSMVTIGKLVNWKEASISYWIEFQARILACIEDCTLTESIMLDLLKKLEMEFNCSMMAYELLLQLTGVILFKYNNL
jgi:hypothetical protein